MAIFRKQKKIRLAVEINEKSIISIDQKITGMLKDVEPTDQDIIRKFVFYFDDGITTEFNGIKEISKYTMQGTIVKILIVHKKKENGIKIILGRESMQEEANVYYYIMSNNEQWFNDSSRKVDILLKEFELSYSVLYTKTAKIVKRILSFFTVILSVYAGIKFIITTNTTNILEIIVTIAVAMISAYLILLILKSFSFLYPDTIFKFGGKQKKKQIIVVSLRTLIIKSLIGGAILGVLTTLIASLIL
jgi:hypothetical protein